MKGRVDRPWPQAYWRLCLCIQNVVTSHHLLLVQAPNVSHLDYCNSCLTGPSDSILVSLLSILDIISVHYCVPLEISTKLGHSSSQNSPVAPAALEDNASLYNGPTCLVPAKWYLFPLFLVYSIPATPVPLILLGHTQHTPAISHWLFPQTAVPFPQKPHSSSPYLLGTIF
jgi:hypothetical protein